MYAFFVIGLATFSIVEYLRLRSISISHPFPHSLTKATLRMPSHRNQKTLNQSLQSFTLLAFELCLLTPTPFSPHILIPPGGPMIWGSKGVNEMRSHQKINGWCKLTVPCVCKGRLSSLIKYLKYLMFHNLRRSTFITHMNEGCRPECFLRSMINGKDTYLAALLQEITWSYYI